ncbi:hypothetical protein [Ornithinimicrobium sufpigmenti]|uniref:hypothetical protein n=1 Tax=Ornithinimicrobium sufpigmenti TaxID=2508882 RepID=UPI0010367356|nr:MULTISPECIES: hypothetical protein [unclassified Ornithinimicrobium]
MALVSIDIGAMESLVNDLTSAKADLPSAATTVHGRLTQVRLGTGSVDQVMPSQEIWTWMEDRVRDLHRRLALARIIASSTPGFGGEGVVEIDESVISTLDDAALTALVDELTGLMETEPGDRTDVDKRILEILREHAHDPYFSRILATQLSPEDLDHYLRAVNDHRQYETRGLDEDGMRAFDERYDSLLNGLGMSLGLASQGTGPLAVPGMAQDWSAHLERSAQFGGAHRLTLVLSRGTFSTDLLLAVHGALKDYEGDRGASAWTLGFGDQVIDPDPARSPGAVHLADPMGALFQALGANPEAMRRIFADGPTTTIETDDGPAEVNAYLWHVLRHRGTDEHGLQQLVLGLQTGVASMPVEHMPAWQPVTAGQLDSIVNAIEREVRIAEENTPPWYASVGHVLLDIVGLVPGLGEWADGLNAAWYTAEGNYTDAAISSAGMIPVVGWFAVGGKWVRRSFTAEELASLGRAVDNGLDVNRMLPGGRVLTDLTQMRDPANFTPQSFLSPWQQRVFADRPWLTNVVAGKKFDDFMAPNYPYNQVYIDYPGGRGGYVKLDSYVPGEEIISRKLTQLNDVTLGTAKGHIDELVRKYPEGARIRDVPSSGELGRQFLDGDMILQVPPQRGGVIPPELAEYAKTKGIRIIDINGFDYTAAVYGNP